MVYPVQIGRQEIDLEKNEGKTGKACEQAIDKREGKSMNNKPLKRNPVSLLRKGKLIQECFAPDIDKTICNNKKNLKANMQNLQR